MALVVDLTVNHRQHIATIEIRRLDPLSIDREEYTYEATLHELGRGAHRLGTIGHHYDLGAIPLAQAALDMAQQWITQRGEAQ